MALPWAAMLRRAAKSCSDSWGVSTAVGSSKMRIRLSRCRSFRISTRCFSPMDRSATRAAGSTSSPKAAPRARTCSRMAFGESRKPGSWPRNTFSATVMASTSMKCW
ncbi:hypothetical protein DSECCO2_401670 [anaerobic digester metagenome]